jgi:integrase
MITVAFRHGLRVSELVSLKWDQIDFTSATLHVTRSKKGSPAVHPIQGDVMRMLRKLQREQSPKSAFVFVSERNAPFSTAGFQRLVERAGVEAELAFPVHPHMLRHAAATHWLRLVTTREQFKAISVTRTLRTRSGTPS